MGLVSWRRAGTHQSSDCIHAPHSKLQVLIVHDGPEKWPNLQRADWQRMSMVSESVCLQIYTGCQDGRMGLQG